MVVRLCVLRFSQKQRSSEKRKKENSIQTHSHTLHTSANTDAKHTHTTIWRKAEMMAIADSQRKMICLGRFPW